MQTTIRVVRHSHLLRGTIEGLRSLFDAEYYETFGVWDPDCPYGYSPADVHVLAFDGLGLIGHVGFQRRLIDVGPVGVLVGGTGGVIVARRVRRAGLGTVLMGRAREAMETAGVDFGYLGCREDVAPFYESCGWRRIRAQERCLSRRDRTTVVESVDTPIMICSAVKSAESWPAGLIDLRGTPW
ncbi:GNAT family N-acetyltransferase [Arthrobacter sp. FW306-2-2C-D06B]|uniref:GNAT family N-acetyltransferase n=1 Tax=Arthrobacter sp. FW306-2-2C-D06B TaxID=2879618 RepID=UPI001F3CE758|nr:GNAT family N-acetyltransferase [Arthrobacter sp. FW306-2-2C-D06B]UKA59385.1 GNAT family N-acetyltransferase [Arthrobacter sp. FW306-2-2C-D06B]